VNKLVVEILVDVRGEIFDAGEHLHPLDNPWEGESWDVQGFVKLNVDDQSVGEGRM